ncbi:F0F1 ATP synthase subunit gamma [Varibaculum cambriense]|uniref:F0F1 ATP synthase subunit gamma n=1 Tax=Varibaculum cambriense TaxID=184870 RepID=UPI00258F3967|nr:F0F1 ATP synthase subunit gamma [Varibaculum cambriense]MDU1223864.1 F0F1 ATP synthase subunit gamma [Varibaculum cambriense]
MSGKQRIYKQKIKATQTLGKVFHAMELIAASRIGKAREAATQSTPFDTAITQALAALAMHSSFDHPITRERLDTDRVAVMCVTSDRGLAGAYSASILRETEKLVDQLKERGKEPVLYAYGRKAESYFRFRGVPVERSWSGNSDSPTIEQSYEIADVLTDAFLADVIHQGVCEVYLVFTRYVNMVKQVPLVRKMLPLEVISEEEAEEIDINLDKPQGKVPPLYEFEPSPEAVLDQILPMYVRSRIRSALLQAAASELASRQTAMHTANDNAQDMIERYTRLANNARQAEITTEITEIVGGAEALAAGR